ncbi:Non-specific serine/threonine protein kinase [Bertholletia excelsa]
MGLRWHQFWVLVAFLAISCFDYNESLLSHYFITNHTSHSWTSDESPTACYGLGYRFSSQCILQRENFSGSQLNLCFGFYSFSLSGDYSVPDSTLLGIILLPPDCSVEPPVVWSANRNRPVKDQAVLNLSLAGGMTLQDADGTLVWSTNTTGKFVAGFNLTAEGNLVLFDEGNTIVWQSFDYPTDTLLPGQKLTHGQKLRASSSSSNLSEGGLYSLFLTDDGLSATVGSDPPTFYFVNYQAANYAVLFNGTLTVSDENNSWSLWHIQDPGLMSVQYVTLEFDGHLRVYDWDGQKWGKVGDLITDYIGECGYPLVCGSYGVCSSSLNDEGVKSVECTCPGLVNSQINYFQPLDDGHPSHGCSQATRLSCNASKYHMLIELENLNFFHYGIDGYILTNKEGCQQACLNNCSCKAAMFYPHSYCYLQLEIYSLMKHTSATDTVVFLKVQNDSSRTSAPPAAHKTKRSTITLVGGLGVGAFLAACVIIFICIFISRQRKKNEKNEEDDLDRVPGMPTRFSYEELKLATKNFKSKLGQGGFGSVFEGTLVNGTKIAVKQLHGLGHIKKSFLAEVRTIGSIHHLNLVRLVGYCAEKSQRLLVYEFMCNGSLDQWIFNLNQEIPLDWKTRRKIILDIARGLAYLHEECQQKVIHLDIKPQNILLEENLNAKVSDFGLSKLIDRDQSEVVTTMKGTPGYMAPEWLTSIISEKVDVYSFGVVVLEILCGRKNLDRSQAEEDTYLLSLFGRMAQNGQLLELVDRRSVDMLSHGSEVVEMMKLAAWCLQSDFVRRPSMSVVVKALEGWVDVEQDLDYNFSISLFQRRKKIIVEKKIRVSSHTPLMPDALSGPR